MDQFLDQGTPETAYDRVPYRSVAFRQTHPDRLGTYATLHGLRPAPAAQARILELGCASGGNLIPLADVYPEAKLLGIDGSARQVADGKRTIEELGLRNIELRHQDILDFELVPDSWDYVLCHGVYSWVPAAVRSTILEICGKCLSPDGVAFVSYNVFPGWFTRSSIRDMLRFRTRNFETPAQQVAQARSLLGFLAESASAPDAPYALALKSENEALKKCEDSYVFHDLLEENNQPVYFHEFCRSAAEHGLQYLSEAEYQLTSLDYFSDDIRTNLQILGRDVVEQEQYMDFLRNRMFRQTLLCRADATLERPAQARRLQNLYISTQADIEANVDPDNPERVAIKRGQAVIKTTNALIKTAMAMARKAWPASVSFIELAAAATSAASESSAIVQTDVMSPQTLFLAETLLKFLSTGHVDLHSTPSRFVTTISERPRTSELARLQAAEGARVTDRTHGSVTLDDFYRQTISLCDGKHDRRQILEGLVSRARYGQLVLHKEGKRLTEAGAIRDVLSGLVDQVLATFARKALLIS